MPLSDRRSEDAWDNLKRQTHMLDIEDALLGVMAEHQAQQPSPPPQDRESAVEPSQADGIYDLPALAIEGSQTVEGALGDLATFAEFTDVAVAVDGDLFAVLGIQLNKDHALALLRVHAALQDVTDAETELIYGTALWAAFEVILDGVYHALRGQRP